MIQNIISSIFAGLFMAYLIHGFAKILVSIKLGKPIGAEVWYRPAILYALAWFFYHL